MVKETGTTTDRRTDGRTDDAKRSLNWAVAQVGTRSVFPFLCYSPYYAQERCNVIGVVGEEDFRVEKVDKVSACVKRST